MKEILLFAGIIYFLPSVGQITPDLIQTSNIYKKELDSIILISDFSTAKIDTFFIQEREYHIVTYPYKNGRYKIVTLDKFGKYRSVIYRDSLLRRTSQYGWDEFGNKSYNIRFVNEIEANGFHWNPDGSILSNYITIGDTCYYNTYFSNENINHQQKYIKGKPFEAFPIIATRINIEKIDLIC
ncbi:MAG: hypothetical protein MUC87_18805 [Bacteroidia bacterium]|jgi:hypothetical protein|nr:hypothetical protein [Bacteroidia bacterium]